MVKNTRNYFIRTTGKVIKMNIDNVRNKLNMQDPKWKFFGIDAKDFEKNDLIKLVAYYKKKLDTAQEYITTVAAKHL